MALLHIGGLTARDIRRLVEVLTVLSRYGFGEVVHRLRLHERLPVKVLEHLHVIHRREAEAATRGERLRSALVELGPTFIKLGQVLSTRPDLIPHDISEDLTQLQDKVPPVPFEEIDTVFVEEFGVPARELFQSFEKTAVASASLSQVYRATLAGGEAVAVKVQRPGVRGTIEADLDLLRFVARWIIEHGALDHWINPVKVVEEFERTIHKELDFRNEMRNIERFRKNFSHMPEVKVPRTFAERTRGRVLTLEWIDGTSVREINTLRYQGIDLHEVATRGARALMKQIFEDGFFHADPHPGNVFILPNNVICFLDYGMVGVLTQSDVDAAAELLMGAFEQNTYAVMRTVQRIVRIPVHVDRRQLERDLHEFLTVEAVELLRTLRIGEGLKQLIDLFHRHSISLPPRFALLLKSLATIEQVAHSLDPTLDMRPLAEPYMRQLVREKYSISRIVREVGHTISDGLEVIRELPGEVRAVLGLIRNGELRIEFQHRGLDNLIHVLDRASNRVSFSVIIGSLIVGSSIVAQTGLGPRVLGVPAIGFAGYFIAAILGLWLVVSIIRSRRL